MVAVVMVVVVVVVPSEVIQEALFLIVGSLVRFSFFFFCRRFWRCFFFW